MKKMICLLLAGLTVAAFMSGCQSQDSTPPPDKSELKKPDTAPATPTTGGATTGK